LNRKFWGKIAEENFTWYQLWDKVVEFDMAEAEIKWFTSKIEHS
jgi:acetyl-CoA synthetase